MTGIEKARVNLSLFVEEMAYKRADEVGFGWKPTAQAPAIYSDLETAFHHSRCTGEDLPISNLHCDTPIFVSPAHNIALRFWHDTLHVENELTFALADEVELALEQLRIAEYHGIRKHSTEWEMLRIEAVGQNYLLGICGRFPLDQRRFVMRCMEIGLDEGLLEESRLHA